MRQHVRRVQGAGRFFYRQAAQHPAFLFRHIVLVIQPAMPQLRIPEIKIAQADIDIAHLAVDFAPVESPLRDPLKKFLRGQILDRAG